jgi:hypothetical protein
MVEEPREKSFAHIGCMEDNRIMAEEWDANSLEKELE